MDREKVNDICAHLEATADMIGFELQRKVSCCGVLENMILGLTELGEEGPLQGAVFMCGVYLGEIIRQEVGGEWVVSDQTEQYCLEVGGRHYFPIEQVKSFAAEPADDELVFFAQAAVATSSA